MTTVGQGAQLLALIVTTVGQGAQLLALISASRLIDIAYLTRPPLMPGCPARSSS